MNFKELLQNEIKSIAFVEVEFESSLINSNILDSITLIDLAIFIEEHTNVNIPTRDINIKNFDSINLIMDYLKKRKNN